MPMLSLSAGARLVGTSRTTLQRAIADGHLTAQKGNSGAWKVDEDALRAWADGRMIRDTSPPAPPPDPIIGELRERVARLEGEAAGRTAQLAAETGRREDAERDRDRWREAAEAARTDLAAERARSEARTTGLLGRLLGRR